MGKLVVLEGLDGSGKSTQFERLDKLLTEKCITHKAVSFPDYEQPSSALVKMYLAGEIGKSADDVNAYAASSFYAVDRYVSYKKFWENDYNKGSLILAARYVTSNCIYQMTKLPKEEWDSYIEWLCHYEYELLGLPRPDEVVFLDMPVEVSQKLLSKRYEGDNDKKDIHEADISFLNKCRETAMFAADKLGWKVIPCAKDMQPLSIDEIGSRLTAMLGFDKL